MHRFLLATFGGLLLAASPPQQQAQPAKPPDAQQPSFTATTQEVVLPVTVTDEKGKFVSNLTVKDFKVLDEGKPQRISFFSHSEKQPIVAGFLVDQSNSMRIHWTKFQDAINEMIWALMPDDKQFQGYLISYSTEAQLAVNTTQDPDKLVSAVRRMKPGGGAALYDAIYRSCTDRKLVKGEPYEPRRIIIIIGDGHDSASKKSMAEVLELAKRNLVTIYAISTMSFGFDNIDQDTLEKLTRETGGHVEYPLNKDLYKDVSGYLSNPSDEGNYALKVGTGGYAGEISAAIIRAVGGIAGEITTQYILRYVPDFDADVKPRTFHRIKVELPELPNTIIRTRDGYYPNGVPGAAPAPGN